MSRFKNIPKQDQNDLSRLMLSAAAGGVLGATTALLLAPKSGKKLRTDLYNAYEDLSDRGQDFLNDAVDRGQSAAKSAGEFADNVRGVAKDFIKHVPEATNPNINLLIGAVVGGCLGATAVYALSSKEEDTNFTQKIRTAGEKIKSMNWIDTAKDVLNTFQNNSHHQNGSEIEDEDEHNTMHDVLEFASLGLRLWDNIKKGR